MKRETSEDDRLLIVRLEQSPTEGPMYYRIYDGEKGCAIFTRKDRATRFDTIEEAGAVISQLRNLQYKDLGLLAANERFDRRRNFAR